MTSFLLSFLSFFADPTPNRPIGQPIALVQTSVRSTNYKPAAATIAVYQQPAPARADAWTYTKTLDASGAAVYKAAIRSPTLLQFDFPYAGGSVATLTLRKGNSTHLYIEVSKGQFNRSFQGGSAQVRFDGQPPRRYTVSAAANGRANIIFLDAGEEIISRMKQARQMRIEVAFHGQGRRQMLFRTAGLIWNH